MGSNELYIYQPVKPCPPAADPPVISIEPIISIEFRNDETHETKVGELTAYIMQGIDSYYLFPEVTNELTEV